MKAFIILASVVVAIFVDYDIAKEFQRIAEMKGHYDKKYFWWSFGLGLIGYAMVIALPDRSGQPEAQPVYDDELPEL